MSKSLRVLQIIDTLNAGGAERMAVQIANGLVDKTGFSGLCCTREEGVLKDSISEGVSLLSLNRKYKFDIPSLKTALRYCKENKVQILHAHGMSFFFAMQLKAFYTHLKIIWHDHNGQRVNHNKKQHLILKLCSFKFSQILCVNETLSTWSKINLNCKRVTYLPNFVQLQENTRQELNLKGEDDKRIVCVANLRPPKNHIFLLKSFAKTNLAKTGWSLHLIGAVYEDEYFAEIQKYIELNNLKNSVFILGMLTNINSQLKHYDIGVLSSKDEGLPMVILEYGLAGLAVLSTRVGQIPKVILNYGKVAEVDCIQNFSEQLTLLASDKESRIQLGKSLQKHIIKNYSGSYIMPRLINLYTKAISNH